MRVGYTMILVFAVLGCAQVSGFDDLEFVDMVDVTFCNSLGTGDADVELTLELGRGHDKAVLSARTGCCTPCATVKAGGDVNAVLRDNGQVLADTSVSLTGDGDYLLLATMDDDAITPMVGFMDLTASGMTCNSTPLQGFSACGSADADADADADTDADSDTDVALPCGGFLAEEEACDTCMRTYCCDEADVCGNNYSCVMLNDCLGGCLANDTVCMDDCVTGYTGGYDDLYAFDDCLIYNCGTAC